MGRAECIVDKNLPIAEFRQLLAERFAVLGLLDTVTGVLEKHNVAVFQSCCRGFGVLADHIVIRRKDNLFAKQLGEPFGHRCERKLGLRLSLGLAHVRAEDHTPAVRHQLFDGRERGHDPVFIGDDAIFQRDVEVTPHEHLFPGNLNVVHGFFVV